MSTQTMAKPSASPADSTPEIFHMFCCDENMAMCGTNVEHLPETNGDGEQLCIVCVEMDEGDCPTCGQ